MYGKHLQKIAHVLQQISLIEPVVFYEPLGSQPVYARIPSVVLYAQTERIEVTGAPASPRAGPFVVYLYRPRIMGAVEPAAHHTTEGCHPVQVALLLTCHA
jgi:hypothetical protein